MDRPTSVEATNLAELYHSPLIDWQRVVGRLERGLPQAPGTGGPDRHTCWLATINPDGLPHLTAVGALWVDGAFWFVSGEQSRKGRNLARDSRCSLSVSTDQFDLVVEGVARRIDEPGIVAAIAERLVADGWPARVDETGRSLTAPYNAPSAGPPPWHVYRLDHRAATAVLTVEPGGATRWRFAEPLRR